MAGVLVLLTDGTGSTCWQSLHHRGVDVLVELGLVLESTAIFLERSPAGLDPAEVGRAIVASEDVVEVHDLHIWTVTSGFPALPAHVLVEREADCHRVRRSSSTC